MRSTVLTSLEGGIFVCNSWRSLSSKTTDIGEDGQLKGVGVFGLPEEMVGDSSADRCRDLLVSRSGTVGRSFLYDCEDLGPCAYAGYLVRFVPNFENSCRNTHSTSLSRGSFENVIS